MPGGRATFFDSGVPAPPGHHHFFRIKRAAAFIKSAIASMERDRRNVDCAARDSVHSLVDSRYSSIQLSIQYACLLINATTRDAEDEIGIQ